MPHRPHELARWHVARVERLGPIMEIHLGNGVDIEPAIRPWQVQDMRVVERPDLQRRIIPRAIAPGRGGAQDRNALLGSVHVTPPAATRPRPCYCTSDRSGSHPPPGSR